MRTILASILFICFAGAAHALTYPLKGGGDVTQLYRIQYREITDPFPFPDDVIAGYDDPHNIGDILLPNDNDPFIIVNSQPFYTANVPVTITDTHDNSSTFMVTLSAAGMALEIVNMFGAPFGDIGFGISVGMFVNEMYGPTVDGVYAGVHDFVENVVNAGRTGMNSGGLPIGPDPLFGFAFGPFTGSFDAYGDISDISGIHNISLFVDGRPVTPGVPEPSSWMMLIIGFVGIARVRAALAQEPK